MTRASYVLSLSRSTVIALIIAFFTLSCTGNDAEAQQAKKAKKTSPEAAPTQSTLVYTLKNVQKAQGVAVADFSWMANGKEVKFSEFTKGKTVFLNYWATWCPPCRREIPDIIQLAKEYGDKVVFIGIALENESAASDAQKLVSGYVTKSGINYINLVGGSDLVQAASGLYGDVQAIPTTFIFGKNGKIAQRIEGSTNKEGFLMELQKAM